MKTLQEYNDDMQLEFAEKNLMKGAGVVCEHCHIEMHYSDEFTLASNPPQRNVHCPNCMSTGYKLV